MKKLLNKIWIIGLLAGLGALVVAQDEASGQSQPPAVVGGTGGLRTPSENGVFGTSARPRQHQSPTGKQCLMIDGLSNPQVVNPMIFEHILIAKNICSQPIKFRACYFQSTSCINTSIAGYTRRQVTLGLAPNTRDFRYSYTEEFN
jgi:hypothetical protein